MMMQSKNLVRGVVGAAILFGSVAALPADAARIVGVGGTVTETVFALGAGDQLVGVDTSSVYPPEATKLPQVGYQRTVSAEGVLSLKPDLVLVTHEAGPPAALEQLRGTGLKVVEIPTGPSLDAARASIRTVATAVDRKEKGEELVRRLEADIEAARSAAAATTTQPRVLFIYARGTGMALVSGKGTAADEMIRLANGVNAVTEFDGFKPLTAEAAVAAAPEVLLVPSRGLDSLGGESGLFGQPGLSLTPAAKSKRVVAMDDLYLLGFGPRTGLAVLELTRALHGPPPAPEAKAEQ